MEGSVGVRKLLFELTATGEDDESKSLLTDEQSS